ncbi:MAG: PP2C family protein-serine/threonine phosphatase [Sedimentisphaerales bacterium]|nr:PP2C family protein-serine/threonine phosphatase [Sedimentisphaerales bacterium]
MKGAESSTVIEVLGSYTDVLYLTDQDSVPVEIERLLSQKKLSYHILPIDQFADIRDRLNLVGTAIIDVKDATRSQKELTRIIERLEKEHIGVIQLTGRMSLPVESFFRTPSSLCVTVGATGKTISIDELWTRMSVNLAHRKGGSARPAEFVIPPRQVHGLHNNTLAEQLKEQLNMTKALADNLTEQLRLAGLVQQDFLPTRLPHTDQIRWATVFLPAEWVSGDIYDIVRVDEEHIGFYITDVVGHGMPAALLTIFIKQALVMRETVGNNYRVFSPAEVVKNLNLRMTAQELSGYQFATGCYGLLNTKTLQLTYARAGHPYPILLRPGNPPKPLEARGSLLGIFEQAEFNERTVQLRAGDKLLLYSDGAEPFFGQFNDQGGFDFNEQFRKLEGLPVDEMVDALNDLFQTQEIDPSRVDDVTLIGLEILPNEPSK